MCKVVVSWDEFIKAQKALDDNIHNNHNLLLADTIEQRKLALLVEFAELINESKCFKYWSKSSPKRDEFLAEYVDVLHFSLSLSLTYGIDLKTQEYVVAQTASNSFLTSYFIDLWPKVPDLIKKENFLTWMDTFLKIGGYLGFSFSEVESSYFKKLNINHKRQEENY